MKMLREEGFKRGLNFSDKKTWREMDIRYDIYYLFILGVNYIFSWFPPNSCIKF